MQNSTFAEPLTLLTVTAEQFQAIKSKPYFRFSVLSITPAYGEILGGKLGEHITEHGFYVCSSKGVNTPQYFAELLAEAAVGSDDLEYQRSVAAELGILELFLGHVAYLEQA